MRGIRLVRKPKVQTVAATPFTAPDLSFPHSRADVFSSKYIPLHNTELQKVDRPPQFHMERLAPFTTASCDQLMIDTAAKYPCFAGSTSSLSTALGQCYQFFSRGAEINLKPYSHHFKRELANFTRRTRFAAKIVLCNRGSSKEPVWVVDQFPKLGEVSETSGLLMKLGHTMEKKFTMNPEQYHSKYLDENTPEHDEECEEAYTFTLFDKLLVRSQQDCQSEYLRTTTGHESGVFDLKSRAMAHIRYNKMIGTGPYLFKGLTGKWRSVEREIYDMSRSAFLKYLFQVHLGRMAGLLVLYHDTETVSGTQYFSKHDLMRHVHHDPTRVERWLGQAVSLLPEVLERVTERMHAEASQIAVSLQANNYGVLTVFAEDLRCRNYGDKLPGIRDLAEADNVSDAHREHLAKVCANTEQYTPARLTEMVGSNELMGFRVKLASGKNPEYQVEEMKAKECARLYRYDINAEVDL